MKKLLFWLPSVIGGAILGTIIVVILTGLALTLVPPEKPKQDIFIVDDSSGPWRDKVVTIRRTMTLTCTLGQLHDWMLMDQPTTATTVIYDQVVDEELVP